MSQDLSLENVEEFKLGKEFTWNTVFKLSV